MVSISGCVWVVVMVWESVCQVCVRVWLLVGFNSGCQGVWGVLPISGWVWVWVLVMVWERVRQVCARCVSGCGCWWGIIMDIEDYGELCQ